MGADAPDAVTVKLYVLGWVCCCCEPLNDVPQPARASMKAKRSSHRPRRDLPGNPNHKRGSGETKAKSNPDGVTVNRLLLVALKVIVVLCAALPDSVAGEKLQPHPLGRPEQANDREALNPFSGATETFKDPAVPCDIARVPLESVSP